MKTKRAGRLLLAAMVCFAAQETTNDARAQAAKSQPKQAQAPATASAQGPPGVEISNPEVALGGAEDVEINFSTPMVPDSMQGKSVPVSSVLEIKPALDAELVWQSSRSATLKVKGLLPLGGSYLRDFHRHLQQSVLCQPTRP